MNSCPEDHVGQRDVKMEAICNRRSDARRRHFAVDDAVYAKDYRDRKPFGRLASSYAELEALITLIAVVISNQLLDVFDLKLFDSRADTEGSTPEDATDPPTPPLRRSSRQRHLNVDPTKKTYS
ncbi:hypothetical protein Aduo_018950 [Ancylostoma duodenale]